MKCILNSIVIVFTLSLLTISCGSSDDNPEVIVDDYYLQAVTSTGKVYKIGNNTGEATQTGEIPTQFNTIILQSICSVDSKIYAFEASYIPAPNRLIIYDKLTDTTTFEQIILPSSILSSMGDPFIWAMKYNGSKFIAVVIDFMSNTNKVISIDPDTYEVTDLEISFVDRIPTSIEIINNDLFIATESNGLHKVNINANSIIELLDNGNRINGSRIAKISNSKLVVMKHISSIVNGIKPYEYDLNLSTFSDKSLGNNYAVGNIRGNSFFYNDEVLDLVYLEENDEPNNGGGIVQFPTHLLKVNYQTNTIETIKVSKQEANIVIVGIVD